jgi:hypothetical protein
MGPQTGAAQPNDVAAVVLYAFAIERPDPYVLTRNDFSSVSYFD